jgi:hypothetical protein
VTVWGAGDRYGGVLLGSSSGSNWIDCVGRDECGDQVRRRHRRQRAVGEDVAAERYADEQRSHQVRSSFDAWCVERFREGCGELERIACRGLGDFRVSGAANDGHERVTGSVGVDPFDVGAGDAFGEAVAVAIDGVIDVATVNLQQPQPG